MHHDRDFGSLLREARMARDMTQEALAEAVGCATQTVRSFENGRRRPSREMAARLSEILQVPPAQRDEFRTLPQTHLWLGAAPPIHPLCCACR
jgi:transcriptional regulator with XRE-family HTH domain